MKAAKPNSLSALYEEKLAAEAYNKGKIYDILQSHKVYKPTKTEVETMYKNRLICAVIEKETTRVYNVLNQI